MTSSNDQEVRNSSHSGSPYRQRSRPGSPSRSLALGSSHCRLSSEATPGDHPSTEVSPGNQHRLSSETTLENQHRLSCEATSRNQRRLSREASPGSQRQLSTEASPGSQHRLNSEASPGNQCQLSCEASPGNQCQLSCEASPGRQRRLSSEAPSRNQHQQSSEASPRNQRRLSSEAPSRNLRRQSSEAPSRNQRRQSSEASSGNQRRLSSEASPRNQRRQSSEASPRNQRQLSSEASPGSQRRLSREASPGSQRRPSSEVRSGNQHRLNSVASLGNQLWLSRAASVAHGNRHRLSSSTSLSDISKTRLCIESFFNANNYEGPYGKHIAVIVHTGTALFIVGCVMAITSFCIIGTSDLLDAFKVLGIVLLSFGIALSLSAVTVYARAQSTAHTDSAGQISLESKHVLIKIAGAITVCIALIGILLVPLSFALSAEIPVFQYLKIVGITYLTAGVFSFVTITVCLEYKKCGCCGNDTREMHIRAHQQQQIHRTRTDSSVLPEIRLETSDTGSDVGSGSDITDALTRQASVISACPQEPPPYTQLDPHPGAWSDSGSTVTTISAAHSMVTLLHFAYADELENLPPPPAYEEAMSTAGDIMLVHEVSTGDAASPPVAGQHQEGHVESAAAPCSSMSEQLTPAPEQLAHGVFSRRMATLSSSQLLGALGTEHEIGLPIPES